MYVNWHSYGLRETIEFTWTMVTLFMPHWWKDKRQTGFLINFSFTRECFLLSFALSPAFLVFLLHRHHQQIHTKLLFALFWWSRITLRLITLLDLTWTARERENLVTQGICRLINTIHLYSSLLPLLPLLVSLAFLTTLNREPQITLLFHSVRV